MSTKLSIETLVFDVLKFRELKPSDNLTGNATAKDGRTYHILTTKNGQNVMIPTCSEKEWKQINKILKS